MIIRPKFNWLRMLFVVRGSVLPQIFPRLIFIFVLSSMVLFFHGELFSVKVSLNATPFTLMGIALALFLGFRNSAAYDRFWEARKLWGMLLNAARTLTRQVTTLTSLDRSSAEVGEFVNLIIAFVYTMKHQLRRTDSLHDLQRLLSLELTERIYKSHFQPPVILEEMSLWLRKRVQEKQLDPIALTVIDNNLTELSHILGGCERIANTPIPYPYTILLHRTVYIYCILLPFGLVDSIMWMTPLICVFVAYTFMALDAIVAQIEDPFGVEDNDLALNTICLTVESTVREMRGEDAPTPPKLNLDQILWL